MNRERMGELFEQARALAAGKRGPFIERLCRDDPEMRAELLSLLAADLRRPAPLEKMAAELLPAAVQDAWSSISPIWRTVSHYLVEEVVGNGGMGVVYKSRDLKLGRLVALKFLRPGLSADHAARRRLESEARAASALDHPNIGVVYEIGTAEGQLFIAMAYYPGETLREKIARGPLPIDEVLHYASQVADGLARAHESGIVHRDIKPANIIVTDRRLAKILDFGLARSGNRELTGEPSILGTVSYMSPEQTLGRGTSHQTDQWSLGAMLYEMLTARRPFIAESDAAVIQAIRHEQPPPLAELRPDVPPALAVIVDRCLAKDPQARYRDTAELVIALQAIPAHSKRPWPRVLAGSLVAAAILAGALLFVSFQGRTPINSRAIATMPFVPAGTDQALVRLGRDLVLPITTELDGVGGLQAIDAARILVEVPDGQRPTPDEARAIAQRLGAGRVLAGVLSRSSSGYRLDLSLNGLGGAEPVVRTSASASDPEALANAAVIAVLDALWHVEPPEATNLVAVTKSQVPAARRAYLQGEIALARLDMPAALQAFESAFAADPTFWWAYWRSLYPRWYRDAVVPPDSASLKQVLQHRFELPEPDRLLVEAATSGSRREQLAGLRELTDRFPHYPEGWWSLANLLVHYGPYLGQTSDDSRVALERFLALNPRFAAGWDHLLWIAVLQGDSTTALKASAEAQRLSQGVATRREWNAVLDLRAAVSVERRVPSARLDPTVEFIATSVPFIAEGLSIGFVADGSPSAQLQLNDAARSRAPSAALSAARWRGDALAWAARGNWPQAMRAADSWARASDRAEGKLGAYRLALAGLAWAGSPAEQASRHRPADARVRSWLADERAELAWLDGLHGYLSNDLERIARARHAVNEAAGKHSALLDRSLAALTADLSRDRQRAVTELRALESEISDGRALLPIGEQHPLLSTAHRLFAARWLRSLGDDAAAAELLTWHEAVPGPALLQAWNTSIGSIALVDRAEIASSIGDTERARRYFTRFLKQYDLPAAGLQPLVQRAATGLDHLDRK